MNWVVFGGQYGSEGKGAFCAYLARHHRFKAAVRAGGPQAGHTFYASEWGGKCVVRQVPVAAVLDHRCIGYIGPGAVIDLTVAGDEYRRYQLRGRLFIHPRACIVTSEHRNKERMLESGGSIPGSTREGVGAARADRALREAWTAGAFDAAGHGWLRECVDHTLEIYQQVVEWSSALDPEVRVMAEGAQGFGLSLWHGSYPHVTSADTTPQAILSECGLPILGTERVIAVLRTFPIRVGGESGPMGEEITWAELGVQPETTTVTGRQRRIAKWDWKHFQQMMRVCQPSHAALMFCDYLDPEVRTKPLQETRAFELWAQVHSQVPCPWIGVGGEQFEVRGAMGLTSLLPGVSDGRN